MRRIVAPLLRARALLFSLLLGLCVPVVSADVPAFRPWLTETPPLKLQRLDGKAFDLAALRGRVTLVNFWATWCEPCRDEMPALIRLRDKLKGRPFEMVAVNYGESEQTIKRFLERHRLDLPVVLDREKAAAEKWGAKGLPMTFLVGADGKIRWWVFGEQDWSEGDAFRRVEAAVGEAQRARR
jgi:thiol-disulfide isomerase/thioredoxin